MTPVLMIMILLFYTFNTLKYLVIFLCVILENKFLDK